MVFGITKRSRGFHFICGEKILECSVGLAGSRVCGHPGLVAQGPFPALPGRHQQRRKAKLGKHKPHNALRRLNVHGHAGLNVQVYPSHRRWAWLWTLPGDLTEATPYAGHIQGHFLVPGIHWTWCPTKNKAEPDRTERRQSNELPVGTNALQGKDHNRQCPRSHQPQAG